MLGKPQRSSKIAVVALLLASVAVVLWVTLPSPWLAEHMLQRGKFLKARQDVAALHRATDRYYSEYSKLPDTGAQEFDTASPAGRRFLASLIGSGHNGPSVRALCHLEPSANERHLTVAERLDRGMRDPWGNPYCVKMDHAWDEAMPIDSEGRATRSFGLSVRVSSYGDDGIPGTTDDIHSKDDSIP